MNEYIERKAVFDKLAVIYDLAKTNQRAVITDALREVSHIPAADVQPVKRGRWEQIGEQSAKCTACGGVLKSNGIDKTGKALIFNAVYHYCPYCGARMEGERNG